MLVRPVGCQRKSEPTGRYRGGGDDQAATAASRAPSLLAVLMAFDSMAAAGMKPGVINNPFQLGKRFILTLICQVAIRIDCLGLLCSDFSSYTGDK